MKKKINTSSLDYVSSNEINEIFDEIMEKESIMIFIYHVVIYHLSEIHERFTFNCFFFNS